jgi:hypothetical protein
VRIVAALGGNALLGGAQVLRTIVLFIASP